MAGRHFLAHVMALMRHTHPLFHRCAIHTSWTTDGFACKSRWFTLTWALLARLTRTFTVVVVIIVLVRPSLHTMHIRFLWSEIWDLCGGPLSIPGSSLLNRWTMVLIWHAMVRYNSLRNAILYSNAFDTSPLHVWTHKLFLIIISLLLGIVLSIGTMSLLFRLLSRFNLFGGFRFCVSSPHFMFIYMLILLYFKLLLQIISYHIWHIWRVLSKYLALIYLIEKSVSTLF